MAGDFLLANIAVNGGDAADITAPSGWTLILRTDNDSNIGIASYYRWATTTEPSNYTWTIDHQTTAKGAISRYSAVDKLNPIDGSATGNSGYGTIATTSPITTTVASGTIVTLFAADVGKSSDAGAYFSTPTGMAERYDLSNTPFGPSAASDEQIVLATGTVAVESSTISWRQVEKLGDPANCPAKTLAVISLLSTRGFQMNSSDALGRPTGRCGRAWRARSAGMFGFCCGRAMASEVRLLQV
jgi:hypothetical protein